MLTPDASQSELLAGPLDERRIVIAGPGAGKTTVSVLLVSEISKVSRYHERLVLYISFSRAAMNAAFGAFKDVSDDMLSSPLDFLPATLDSLAWQITSFDGESNESQPNFDRIVASATAKLIEDYAEELDDVVHLIVDEAQDLSPVRQDLLFAIIDRLPSDAGVTIFGDPMQSIYGFSSLGSCGVEQAWRRLLAGLAERSITKTYRLDGAHRALRAGPRKVASVLQSLDQPEDALVREVLDDLMGEFPVWEVSRFVHAAKAWTGTTAVLARTNPGVAALFHALTALGLTCVWNPPSHDGLRVSPAITRLWKLTRGANLTSELFEVGVSADPRIPRDWFASMLGETGNVRAVNWDDFARTLRAPTDRSLPWLGGDQEGVVLSTIHRAKGLEWDNVAVVDGIELISPVGDREPEVELAYVALSRARERIVLLEWNAPFFAVDKKSKLGYQPHPRTRRPARVCIVPSFLAGKKVGGDRGQDVLASCDYNSEMEFELLASGDLGWPVYRCKVGGVAVGVTSDEFGQAFARLLGPGNKRWPNLSPVPIDGVETRWSTLGATEFWLRPRPLGVATISWGEQQNGES